jgi:Spy/CpxP family protein refolding chaperone
MKNLLKLSLLTLGLAAVSLPAFSAENDTATPPAHAVRRPLLKALVQRRAALRQKVAKKLDLTADQKAQLKAKRASVVAAVKAIRHDASLTPEQKKAKARETLQAARADVRNVLTADQQAKLQKARQHLRQRLNKAAN